MFVFFFPSLMCSKMFYVSASVSPHEYGCLLCLHIDLWFPPVEESVQYVQFYLNQKHQLLL